MYSKSILIHPTTVCYCNRSLAYFKIQNFKKSLEDATKSIQLDKNSFKGYFRRAEAHVELGDYELAIDDFEQSILIRADNNTKRKLVECKRRQAEILKEEGNEVLKTGDVKRAIELYTKSIDFYPTSHCYGNRSLAHYKLQNYKDAVADATDSLQCDKNNSKGFLRRADAYMALKENEQALIDYKRALELNPNDSRTQKRINKLTKLTSTGKGMKLISYKWERL